MPTTIDMPTTNMLPLLLKALKTDNIVNLYVIKTDTTFTIDLRKYRKIPKKIFNNIKLKPNFKSIQQKFVLRKIINNINKLMCEHIRNTVLIKSDNKRSFTALSSEESKESFKQSLIYNNFQNYLLVNNLS
jgi:hypothetical protein